MADRVCPWPFSGGSAGFAGWLAVAILMAPAGMLHAATAAGIFSAEVAVADRSEEARELALQDAMQVVLVRVTGQRRSGSDEFAELAASAGLFVQAFQYRRESEALRLSVRFDGEAVENAVAARGLPVWGRERPEVLAWIAADYGGGNRAIVAADSDGYLAGVLREAAAERGLPLRLPLMDAEDREKINFADVWGGFSDAVAAASSRYSPDALLTGKVRRVAGGRFSIDWTLDYRDRRISGRGGVGDGIHGAADYFAGQFAVVSNGVAAAPVILEVAPLERLEQYGQVLAHLGALSVVAHVGLRELNGDTATFELQLRGDSEQLRRALELGRVLAPAPGDIRQPFSQTLHYRPVR